MTKDGGDRRMTREQVHDLMENELRCVQRGNYCDRECAKCPLVKDDKELIEAYGYVIKELEQEPREDTISRKDTLKAMIEKLGIRNEDYLIPAEATLYKIVKNMPPATPQQKTGHWIIKDGKEQGYDIGGVKTWYIQIMCSECGFIKTAIEGHTGQYHYCPNCGARMQEVENG